MLEKRKRGRPSIKDEKLILDALTEALFKEQDVNKLQDRINSRKYSVFDMMLWRSLQEDGEKDRKAIYDRVVPERVPEDKDGNAQSVQIYLPSKSS